MKSTNEGRSLAGAASDDLVCPLCESTSIDTFLHSDVFKYGSGDSAVTLRVENLPVRRCTSCDLEFIDHEGAQLRHEAVCRHLGVLTPAQVREIREGHGMTRAAFAEATGLGAATLGRWETGAVVQNRANDLYLRLTRFPLVMTLLQRMSVHEPESVPESCVPDRTFRSVVVDEKLRKRQSNFHLRLDVLPASA